MTALTYETARSLARLIRDRELSAREVMTAHLERIEQVNGELNAIVSLDPERAMAGAAAADEALAGGADPGPLHGLPIAHKDLSDVAGWPTTQGSPLFRDHIAETDSLLVERYRQAGAVVIGKSNTPEFGAGSHTFNPVFGVTRNPYDPARTCGGSSGGAAVALATGMLPIADGSDLGGSLRNPASYCNVVGFRPSPGRVPTWPRTTAWTPMSTEGPMGRTVDDVALQMGVLARFDPRSPVGLETDPSMFDLAPLDRPVRVAWSHDLGGLPMEPAITDALVGARTVMEEMGWEVMDATPDLSDAAEIFQTYRALIYEAGEGPLLDAHGDQLKETVRWNVQAGRNRSLADFADATRRHEALFQRVRLFFEDVDVLACPVAQVPPFPVEVEYPTEVAGVAMHTYIDWMRSCSDITVTGSPAISVPGGFTGDGLPVGLQLVGPHRADGFVLQVAAAFEAAHPLGLERPPV